MTEVPGSHGPKQSGSVIVPTEVPTHISTISFGSVFIFFAGGGLALSSHLTLAVLMADDPAEPLLVLELPLLVEVEADVFGVEFNGADELFVRPTCFSTLLEIHNCVVIWMDTEGELESHRRAE